MLHQLYLNIIYYGKRKANIYVLYLYRNRYYGIYYQCTEEEFRSWRKAGTSKI